MNDHYKYIVTAFETFHKRKAGIWEINDDIQTQWNYVVDMVIAETFRHSTFMLSYEEFEEDGIKQMKLNQISFIDLDTRKITDFTTKVRKYTNEYLTYIDYTLQHH